MSNTPRRYLLDTNVFIQASQKYYAFDLALPFWTELTRRAQRGCVRSVDRVFDEINQGNDRLVEWVNDEFSEWFKDTKQPDVLESYTKIQAWADTKEYKQKARDDFARDANADPWVVAYAHSKKFVVVTEEKINYEKISEIPIPNVCVEFDVECVNTFTMMRELNIIFR